MNYMDKRGLSDVLVTVLVILISVLAIAMIWQVLRGVLYSSAGQINTGRILLDLEIVKSQSSVSDSAASLKVRRNPGQGDLTGINFIFENATMSYVNETATNMQELQEMTFTFELTDKISNITRISLAPVLSSSKGEKLIGEVIYTWKVQ